jgi:hypothetical protein
MAGRDFHPGLFYGVKKIFLNYLVFNNIVLYLLYQITIKHTHHDKANFNNQVDHKLRHHRFCYIGEQNRKNRVHHD